MKQTPQIYEKAVKACVEIQGPNVGWNLRFLIALDANGLMLSHPNLPRRSILFPEKYPKDGPFMAPIPAQSDGIRWSTSYIVWKNEEAEIVSLAEGPYQGSRDRFSPPGFQETETHEADGFPDGSDPGLVEPLRDGVSQGYTRDIAEIQNWATAHLAGVFLSLGGGIERGFRRGGHRATAFYSIWGKSHFGLRASLG